MSHRSVASGIATFWMAFQMAACGESPTQPQVPPVAEPPVVASRLTLSGVDALVPGQTAHVRGQNLDRLSTLKVGGQTVSFQKVSDTDVQFTVPEMRSCETDGRSVEVLANDSVQTTGQVRVPGAVHLEVGESRLLDADDLTCLQFSQEGEDYVLSVANLSLDHVIEPVFRLRTRPANGDTLAAPSYSRASSPALFRGTDRKETLFRSGARALAQIGAVENTVAFDPTYATAKVGDVITLVDWARVNAPRETPRASAPTYSARVVAVEGRQVIAVDMRLDSLSAYERADVQQTMKDVAAMVDRTLIPAMRAVIDPSFQPLPGAGGRMLTVIENRDGASGVRMDDAYPSSAYPAASRMMVVSMPKSAHQMRPSNLAGVIVHEFTHIADFLPKIDGTGAASSGWYSEAVANAVRETAARLARGAEQNAPLSSGAQTGPDAGPLAEWPSRFSQTYSPWGSTTSAGLDMGAYDIGARLLLFAREKMGQAGFTPSSTLLHQRLKAKGRWDIEAIAEETGLSVEQLLDEFVLANVTDDLVPSEAVRRMQLPQFTSWDTHRAQNGEDAYRSWATDAHLLSRGHATEVNAAVPAGSYHHWYIPGEAGKGLSIQADNVRLQPHHRVRLTRLR